MPLPRVIYNRVANRRAEGAPAVQRVLRWLREEGVVVFNPGFLDKWEVYAALQADAHTRRHVPETVLYTRPGQVAELLHRWGVLYCKPRRGSLGNGITALRLRAGGKVGVMRNSFGSGTISERLPSIAATGSWAMRHLRPRRWCLQQGVNLATVHARPFDIRALAQKDEEGHWQYTGAAARLAGRGQLTTHVPRGGSRMSLQRALYMAVRGKAEAARVQDELAAISIASATCLEQALGNEYGEFSLDVGLDQAGHLWVLEMNAKPFRFDEPEIRRRAYRRLMGFARYLAVQEA